MFPGQTVEEGVVVSGLRPLSQAPAEFNSKVQSAFAPSQIKGRSAGEMSWLIKDRRGPGRAGPPPLSAHTLCP